MMQTMLLAKVFGVTMLVVALGMAFNTSTYKKVYTALKKDVFDLYIAGFMNVFLGTYILVTHNIWEGTAMIVTILGLIMVIKGAHILLFPNSLVKLNSKMMTKLLPISLTFAFAIAGVLLWLGFFSG